MILKVYMVIGSFHSSSMRMRVLYFPYIAKMWVLILEKYENMPITKFNIIDHELHLIAHVLSLTAHCSQCIAHVLASLTYLLGFVSRMVRIGIDKPP